MRTSVDGFSRRERPNRDYLEALGNISKNAPSGPQQYIKEWPFGHLVEVLTHCVAALEVQVSRP